MRTKVLRASTCASASLSPSAAAPTPSAAPPSAARRVIEPISDMKSSLDRDNSQNGKSPYRGQARRNKLLVSWRPLVIAPPLAGSLLAPLRCAAPCQSRSRAAWPHLQDTRKLLCPFRSVAESANE